MTKASILSYLYPQLVETRKSKYNQKIKIYRFLGSYFISVGDLTQSGGLVTKIWEKVVDHTSKHVFTHSPPKNILMLGLGAGSAVKKLAETWPKADIVGLEIDPIMIDIGQQYFHLKKYSRLTIINADAISWMKKNNTSYDLLLVDMYQGPKVPEKSETKTFLNAIKTSLSDRGVVVFNRLGVKEQQSANQAFLKKIKTQFPKVERIKTPVNQVYLASS